MCTSILKVPLFTSGIFFLFIFDRISLCSYSCPGTHEYNRLILKSENRLPLPWVQGLKVCTALCPSLGFVPAPQCTLPAPLLTQLKAGVDRQRCSSIYSLGLQLETGLLVFTKFLYFLSIFPNISAHKAQVGVGVYHTSDLDRLHIDAWEMFVNNDKKKKQASVAESPSKPFPISK